MTHAALEAIGVKTPHWPGLGISGRQTDASASMNRKDGKRMVRLFPTLARKRLRFSASDKNACNAEISQVIKLT